ncbi:glutamine-hydrolyzing carbamoyl-phosphate synthase small subunit [Phenylobacterium sp. LH3H17]|uniref:glutamine-hydrolyzing carbamoyl-phosphate synthase small subunit n=1 Tax=Phenylobacterium sp. LH3H17 TaxID=2903901 RepID=UPI0020C969B4|nr:glutamine-hydrolyzing carbamoyl-phosphate synthase small subunit [Phenylobacterium sp. LH3H17]UTP38518.1 glutamine-hydrolyzing carbamoyl-phosphate synthase small subunit [Phenylobacterium sp. LH3H17]
MTTDLLAGVTGLLVLADGTVLQGIGVGAAGEVVGEVCFNTAMTGYQEILTDPSYMSQIVAFTFPHMGNTGVNTEDIEQMSGSAKTSACGAIFRDVPTAPANWRSEGDLDTWMKRREVVGLAGVDTRALTRAIREKGMPHGVIAHSPDGKFDIPALVAKANAWSGLVGLDLAKDASCLQPFVYDEGLWTWPEGYAKAGQPKYEVVVLDYGVKRNILRALTSIGARATVVPASTSAEDILARKPDGILLSNGPGDPAATGEYAVPEIKKLVDSGVPVFGICLGHQMMALALGATTVKMEQGHHGANHPVKDITTGKVEIVSMNHGFTVDRDSLPEPVVETHVSLFDGTNAGIALKDRPVFSVQHHPEASPGPTDSLYLFERFAGFMDSAAK